MSSGELSARELVGSTLARIEAVDPMVHAFVEVYGEAALAQAEAIDNEPPAARRGPLQGIPVVIKDIIDVAGHATTAGTSARAEHRATTDAAVVSKLRAAGAIVIGKTVTHEWAFGVTSPPTRNPWNLDRIPGGSSGGSAAAVASRCALIGIGSDTGGSIRIPAALCGVVGLKPTHGTLSVAGVIPNSWSLDVIGPITRSVDDAELAFDALTSPAPSEGRRNRVERSSRRPEVLRVGIPREFFYDHVRDDIARGLEAVGDDLRRSGVRVEPVSIPMTESIVPVYSVIQACEASANHRRMLESESLAIGEPIRRVLRAGLELPAWAYLDALRARESISAAFRRAFDLVDVLLAPTTPVPAFRSGEESAAWPDGTVESIWSLYSRICVPANVMGLPALTVPSGFTDEGLPFGAQLIAPPHQESRLMDIGRLVEHSLASRGIWREFPELDN